MRLGQRLLVLVLVPGPTLLLLAPLLQTGVAPPAAAVAVATGWPAEPEGAEVHPFLQPPRQRYRRRRSNLSRSHLAAAVAATAAAAAAAQEQPNCLSQCALRW